MVKIFRLVLFCLFILSITVSNYADDNTEIRELLSKHYQMKKPDGDGPFPSIMMVPGCSGFDAEFLKAFYDSIQAQLVELGFVTLRVNYLAARNFSSCSWNVSTYVVGDDIRITADYLRQQTFVKKGAINVIAWSYGSAGAMTALMHTKSIEAAQIDALIAYYPYCSAGVMPWDSEVPVLVLTGAIDTVAPLSKCGSIFDELPKRDKLTIRVYKDAHHAFDNSTLPAEMKYEFGILGYNEIAAKSAWKEVINFLRR